MEQYVVGTSGHFRRIGAGQWCVRISSLFLIGVFTFPLEPQEAAPSRFTKERSSETGFREALQGDPLSILRMLQGSSLGQRKVAYQRLFGNTVASEYLRYAPSARLRFVQLDQDEDLEAVLVIDVVGGTSAFVFDRSDGAWWKIAKFDNVLRGGESFERMLEVQNIVSSTGGADLIVRKWGYGTGGYALTLAIYRLRSGVLHKIFEVVEEQVDGAVNQPGVQLYYQRRFLYYPDRDETKTPLIIVHHMEVGVPPNVSIPATLIFRGVTVSCTVHRWDDSAFIFRPDAPSTRRFCDPIVRGALGRPR